MKHTQIGTGPALLLLPGLGCDTRMWEPVAEQLADRFTVVHPHTWGGGPLIERTRELKVLVENLSGRPVGLAGLSMGGYLTFECLRQWPELIRAAALLDTTAYEDDEALDLRRLGHLGDGVEVGLRHTPPGVLLLGLAQGVGDPVRCLEVDEQHDPVPEGPHVPVGVALVVDDRQ